jgi:hypothetical protein
MGSRQPKLGECQGETTMLIEEALEAEGAGLASLSTQPEKAQWGEAEFKGLLGELRADDPRTRAWATLHLGQYYGEDGGVIDPLLARLRLDEAWEVRAVAAWGLNLTREERVLAPLFAALGDPAWQVRAAVIATIQEVAINCYQVGQLVPVVNQIMPYLQDPTLEVRLAAAEAVGGLGSGRDEVITALIGLYRECVAQGWENSQGESAQPIVEDALFYAFECELERLERVVYGCEGELALVELKPGSLPTC